jgi:hypothetical protein
LAANTLVLRALGLFCFNLESLETYFYAASAGVPGRENSRDTALMRQNMTTACAFCTKVECFPPFFDPLLFRRHEYRLTPQFFDNSASTVLGMANFYLGKIFSNLAR